MLNIDFSQVVRLEVRLTELQRRLGDLSSFFKGFAERHLEPSTERVFTTEGYGMWPELDPKYAARKSITHPGQSILRRDDAYFDAATTIGHPGNVLEVSPTELVYGVSGGYFQSSFGYNYPEAHEEGIGQKPRPVFRSLAASPEIQNLYATALEAWASEQIQEVF